MKLDAAIEAFLTALAANGRSPLTIDCYRRDLGFLASFAGEVEVGDLTADTIHRFVLSDAVQKTTAGAAKAEVSIGRTKAALKSLGRYLTDLNLVDRDPAGGLEIRRVGRQHPKALTDEERKRLVRALNARHGAEVERDRVILAVFLATGIRLRELAGLDVGDVRLDEKRLIIRAKGGRLTSRFLNSPLRGELRRHLRGRPGDAETPALFLSSRGERLSARQIQTRFHQWLRWAEIDRPGLTVHSLRHTFGTRLYRRSHDLLQTAKAMGHSSLESTRVYVELNDADLEDLLETI